LLRCTHVRILFQFPYVTTFYTAAVTFASTHTVRVPAPTLFHLPTDCIYPARFGFYGYGFYPCNAHTDTTYQCRSWFRTTFYSALPRLGCCLQCRTLRCPAVRDTAHPLPRTVVTFLHPVRIPRLRIFCPHHTAAFGYGLLLPPTFRSTGTFLHRVRYGRYLLIRLVRSRYCLLPRVQHTQPAFGFTPTGRVTYLPVIAHTRLNTPRTHIDLFTAVTLLLPRCRHYTFTTVQPATSRYATYDTYRITFCPRSPPTVGPVPSSVFDSHSAWLRYWFTGYYVGHAFTVCRLRWVTPGLATTRIYRCTILRFYILYTHPGYTRSPCVDSTAFTLHSRGFPAWVVTTTTRCGSQHFVCGFNHGCPFPTTFAVTTLFCRHPALLPGHCPARVVTGCWFTDPAHTRIPHSLTTPVC